MQPRLSLAAPLASLSLGARSFARELGATSVRTKKPKRRDELAQSVAFASRLGRLSRAPPPSRGEAKPRRGEQSKAEEASGQHFAAWPISLLGEWLGERADDHGGHERIATHDDDDDDDDQEEEEEEEDDQVISGFLCSLSLFLAAFWLSLAVGPSELNGRSAWPLI